MDKPDFMTTDEICDLFKVSTKTVYRWKQAGKLTGHKVGRRLFYDPAEVRALAGDDSAVTLRLGTKEYAALRDLVSRAERIAADDPEALGMTADEVQNLAAVL